ncbi:MAG: hypothetical protein ABL951_15990 [Alphaproteobacteria bacterium]
MKAAIDAGFSLEVIAIAESLMTDRLMSYANCYQAKFDPNKTTLGKVARKVVMLCKEKQDD